MKTHYLIIMTGIAIVSVIANIILLCVVEEPTSNAQSSEHFPTFVWNDDIDSLPEDGSTVLIQETINDTIYLGVNEDDCDYQFIVIDNMVAVYDGDRRVGTIRLDGSLEKLINKDNE